MYDKNTKNDDMRGGLCHMEQTNRTLLFEMINPNKDNLLSLIGTVEGEESLSDDIISEIHQKLVVSSFQEFLEKFKPVAYLDLDTDKKTVGFTLDSPIKDTQNIIKVNFDLEYRFFKMLVHMLDSNNSCEIKRESFSQIVEHLLPKLEIKTFTEIRTNIRSSFQKGDIEEAKRLLDTLDCQYNKGLLQLQLFISEAKKEMQERVNYVKKPIVLKDIEDTQIKVVNMSEAFKNMEADMDSNNTEAYKKFIHEYMDKEQIQNRELFRWNLLHSCHMSEKEAYDYCKIYNEGLEYYGKLVSVFWEKVMPLLQTLMGIKGFFNQYTIEEGIMPPTLIISNCTMEQLMLEKNRRKFTVYLETVNDKNYYASTIWYGIIPRLPFVEEEIKPLTRERFLGTEREESENTNSIEAAYLLIDICAKYRIQSFISVNPTWKNTIHSFASGGISLFDSFRQAFENVGNKESIIPCMPNFTMIPKEHSYMELGYKYRYEEFSNAKFYETDKKTVWLKGLYIEASYVAAGLFAACQCPTYLQKYYKRNVDMEVPGVAYHVSGDNRKKTTANIGKEICNYSSAIREEVMRKSFGVVFAAEKEGVTVLTDRTVAYTRGNNNSITHVQTLTYIERVIRYATQDFKSNLIVTFFQNRPGSITEKWMKSQKCINSILKENESMEYSINEQEGTCTFSITFAETKTGKTVSISK